MSKNELLAKAEKLDLETLDNRTEFLEVTCDYKGNCEETSDQPN